MTPIRVATAVMVMLCIAGACFARSVRRAPASVEAARRRMSGHNAMPGRHARLEPIVRRPVAFVEARLGSGLATIDTTPWDVVTRVATSFVAVFLILMAGVVTMAQLGVLPWTVGWLPGCGLLAAAAAWTVWRGVGARIRRRRDAVRRAANDFVQLVAVGLTTDHSVEEAIRFALDVGEGDAFEVVRVALLAGPQRGVAVWDTLRELSVVYDVRELDEFASSVERQGLQGVSIGATVASLAVAMRERALDELERAADRANANLAGPTIGFVVATVVFLAYPLAERIGEAFGG